MIRIYLISILTATFIAVIICLCISLSKPKESFTKDPPPGPGAVLLADDSGSLTTYPLQNLIAYVEYSVNNLNTTVQQIQNDLKTTQQTVSDNLQEAKGYTDQKSGDLSTQLTSRIDDLDQNKQPKGDYIYTNQPIAIKSKVNDSPTRDPSFPPAESWLANGAGIKYKTDQGKVVNPAYLSPDQPKDTHTCDRLWEIIPWHGC